MIRERLPALDGLRFIAAMSVVLAHAAPFTALPDSLKAYAVSLSGLGMSLFFVLSGFVIFFHYGQRISEGGGPAFAAFMWARFSRLYPLFFVMVAFDIVARTARSGPWPILEALPYYLTMTHSWVYLTPEQFSLIYRIGAEADVSWSISTEWLFYVAFAGVGATVWRINSARSVTMALVAVCVLWIALCTYLFRQMPAIDAFAATTFGPTATLASGFQDSFFRWIVYFSPYVRIGEFIAGCLLARLYLVSRSTWQAPRPMRHAAAAAVVLGAAVCLHYAFVAPPNFLKGLGYNFALAPVALAAVWLCAVGDNWLSELLSRRPAVAFGEASYGVYFLHIPALHLMHILVPRWLSRAGYDLHPLNAAMTIVLSVLSIGLVLMAARVSWVFLEKPARDWLRRRPYFRKPAPVAVS